MQAQSSVMMKRPKSSVTNSAKYRPFNHRSGFRSNNQINFNNYGTHSHSRAGMTNTSSTVNINHNQTISLTHEISDVSITVGVKSFK